MITIFNLCRFCQFFDYDQIIIQSENQILFQCNFVTKITHQYRHYELTHIKLQNRIIYFTINLNQESYKLKRLMRYEFDSIIDDNTYVGDNAFTKKDYPINWIDIDVNKQSIDITYENI